MSINSVLSCNQKVSRKVIFISYPMFFLQPLRQIERVLWWDHLGWSILHLNFMIFCLYLDLYKGNYRYSASFSLDLYQVFVKLESWKSLTTNNLLVFPQLISSELGIKNMPASVLSLGLHQHRYIQSQQNNCMRSCPAS